MTGKTDRGDGDNPDASRETRDGEYRGRRHNPEVYVALAAFLLSFVVACAGVFVTLRGSVVDALEPREVLVYRNGSSEEALLTIAVQVPMINRSANNDVITEALLRVRGLDHSFESEDVTVSPVRLARSVSTEEFCGRQATICVPLSMMAIVTNPGDVVIVPAGGAHARYYRFRLICPVSLPQCAPYRGGYLRTLEALGDRRISFTLTMALYADGERTIRCDIGSLDRDYIQRNGWQSMNCAEPVISGNPMI